MNVIYSSQNEKAERKKITICILIRKRQRPYKLITRLESFKTNAFSPTRCITKTKENTRGKIPRENITMNILYGNDFYNKWKNKNNFKYNLINGAKLLSKMTFEREISIKMSSFRQKVKKKNCHADKVIFRVLLTFY